MGDSKDWQVENLRITMFPENNARISPSSHWDEIIAEDADNVQIQPGRLNARHVDRGHGVIFLIKQSEYIEWRYLGKPDENRNELRLPIVGSLFEELDVILELSRMSLRSPSLLPINRLAFGAVLLLPAQSLNTGFANLQDFFPKINFQRVNDFDYRVNRRRNSEVVKDLEINRISQWSVARLERVADTLDPASSLADGSSSSAFASRLELDVNTVQRRDALQSDSLVDLFNELIHLGTELSERGDVS